MVRQKAEGRKAEGGRQKVGKQETDANPFGVDISEIPKVLTSMMAVISSEPPDSKSYDDDCQGQVVDVGEGQGFNDRGP